MPRPVFERALTVALSVVSRSCPSSEINSELMINIVKYMMVNVVTFDTVSADMVRAPILTGTTALGCSRLYIPLTISLNTIMTLTTFMEPQVEAEQPPISIRQNKIIWLKDGHSV